MNASSDGPVRMDVRQAAARVVERTLVGRQPLESLLWPAESDLAPRDRALLRELVFGSLRWLRRLDHVISAASRRPTGRIDRRLRSPLRVAAYQLLYLDRIPAYAAVDRAVADARRRRGRQAAGFVNAVLRRIADTALEDWPVEEADLCSRLGIEHSHPDLLVAAWLDRFGAATTERLLRVNNGPRPLGLLAFSDRGGRERLQRDLAASGVDTTPSPLAPLGLIVDRGDPLVTPAFARGDFYVQDAASQAVALLPPPRAGERILDVAAAPGGKTFSMMAWEPGVRIIAGDRHLGRLLRLRQNLDRLGRSVPLLAARAEAPAFDRPFDRVVIDLPCTGSGILRRHPELRWRITGTEVKRLAQQGLELLMGVAGRVKEGGLLVLVTCSIEPQENEAVVSSFLSREPSFVPLSLQGRIPAVLDDGIQGVGWWRSLPATGSDGFTTHVLKRGRSCAVNDFSAIDRPQRLR